MGKSISTDKLKNFFSWILFSLRQQLIFRDAMTTGCPAKDVEGTSAEIPLCHRPELGGGGGALLIGRDARMTNK